MVSSDYRTRQARWAQEDAAWREVLALTEQPESVDLDEGGSEREAFAVNLAKHYLSGELDADRNDRCVCGHWVGGDPGVCPGWDDHIADVAFDWFLSRYTITRKQPEPEPEPSPVCDCGETVERWGQPCDACRNPVVIMEVDDA